MAISDTIESVPAWGWAIAVGVVVLALMSHASSAGGSGVGSITTYQPTPVDPGIVAIQQQEIAAKSSGFSSLVSLFTATEIAQLQNVHDITLGTIQADAINQRTAAEERASIAATNAAQAVGIVQSNNQTAAEISANETAATINRTNVAGATSAAHIAAKSHLGDQIVGGIKTIASFFGF